MVNELDEEKANLKLDPLFDSMLSDDDLDEELEDPIVALLSVMMMAVESFLLEIVLETWLA